MTTHTAPRSRTALVWLAGLGLAGLTGLAAPPATAAADHTPQAAPSSYAGSIVFIKANNVWLAKGDGSGQYQVTTNGSADSPWSSPTQSDTGVIAASHGQDIVVMSQNGTVLRTIDPTPLTDSVSHPVDGVPQDLAFSPDGTKIAYTFYSYGCPIGADCLARTATGITAATGLTPAATYGTTYQRTPSWIGNGRTLQSGGWGSHMKLKDVGGAEQLWFNDYDYAADATDLGDGEVSPDGHWLAAVRGYSSSAQIIWYAVSGNPATDNPPPVPDPRCSTGKQAGFADPTWAPDSNAVAWQEPDGIWVKDDPADCTAPQPRLLVAGGSEPDWSAAAANPAPRAFAVSGKLQVSGKAKVGKRLTAGVPAFSPTPSAMTFQWLRGGKPIKGATASTYKVTKQDRGKKLAVTVTGSLSAYPSVSLTSPAVTVKKTKKRHHHHR
ncbi:hypothetical protein G5V58_22615 [Nocardioides anomalus]|uniref:WD40 repeat domain-containing protein n=1 Tax=Nocardioides anomalus TaxID=2712223 RepID=A0A6G6WIW1_9ACTN|nr:hypothetical protein [Nocardioides anomalus]QIG45184.1 hypothetical protein G5V58_22615 [Nocardioides anomalus]